RNERGRSPPASGLHQAACHRGRMKTFAWIFLFAAAAFPGCSCSDDRGHGPGGPGSDIAVPPIGSITIDPTDVTLDIMSSGPPPTQAFTVTLHAADGDHDVSGQCTYALADSTLGVMNANVFTAGTAHGGSTTLVASLGNQTAQASIHIRVSGTFTGPTCMTG